MILGDLTSSRWSWETDGKTLASTKCRNLFYFKELQYANYQDKQSVLTTFPTILSPNLLNSDAVGPSASQIDENYTAWLINPFIAVILNKVHTMYIKSKNAFYRTGFSFAK